MGRKVGLWIDHDKAIIISIDAHEEEVSVIRSNVDSGVRLSGGSRSNTPYIPMEKVSERKIFEPRQHQLHRYYHEVIDDIRGAEKILIFGPDEAKGELEKQMEQSNTLSRKIAGLETVDKMTKGQIRSKVREYYLYEEDDK